MDILIHFLWLECAQFNQNWLVVKVPMFMQLVKNTIKFDLIHELVDVNSEPKYKMILALQNCSAIS